LIMINFFSIAKMALLNRLPVPMARKYLQRDACKSILPATTGREKQLLVDVSVIIKNDNRTGIQRVVRALLLQLLRQPPVGFRVRPVFATRNKGYRYAPEQFGLPDAQTSSLNVTSAVETGPGDIFLGLDLAAHLLSLHKIQLEQWKCSGAKIHIVVYDLLPVLHPHWFNSKTTRNFHRWLRTIAIFTDSAICISNSVKSELNEWLFQKYKLARGVVPISTIPLGADIESSSPSRGLLEDSAQLLTAFASKPTVMLVGTLEPRKGHGQVLDAFEKLWLQGGDINLVFVGKPGWKTEKLQKHLRAHPQNKHRLYWLDNASDEFLDLLYGACTGVIIASHEEGFGLPLIEASYRNKPVLARDIPVLREIGGNFVTFFSGASTESLVNDIELWLAKIAVGQIPLNVPQHNWKDSAQELLNCLGLGQIPIEQDHHMKMSLPRMREGAA